jgi:DNA-binding CsgD family transcriptional regulator
MHLIERDVPLGQVDQLLGRCLAGQGSFLVVNGPAGCGNSAFVAEVLDRAQQRGIQALRAVCSPMEKEIPGSVLSQLLLSAPASAEPLVQQASGIDHQFCAKMVELATSAPLLITVDDVDHADADSLRSLLYLARRLVTTPILLVATSHAQHRRALLPAHQEQLYEAASDRLVLTALSRAGVTRVLAGRFGAQAGDLAAEFHRLSAGNPSLLSALIEDRCRWDGDGEFLTEAGYGAAVLRLLRHSEPAVLRLAQALAVLADCGSTERAAFLIGLAGEADTDTVSRASAALTGYGLLRDGRLSHPVARSATLSTLAGGDRVALQQRAARLLYEQGEPAEVVAHQLAIAGRRPEPWAVPVLIEAADRILLTGRSRLAVSYLQLAHEASEPNVQHGVLQAKLADAVWRESPAAASRYLPALAAEAVAGRLDGATAVGVVRQLLWHGRLDEASEVVDRLRGPAGAWAASMPELRDLQGWLAFSYPLLAGRHQPRPWDNRSRPAAEQVAVLVGGDSWLSAAAGLSQLLIHGQGGKSAEWVEQVLGNLKLGNNTSWASEAALLALEALLTADLPDSVLQWCDVLTADDRQPPTWLALMSSLRAEALLRRGELLAALAEARNALDILPAHAWGVLAGLPLSTLITAAVRSGKLAEAAEHLVFTPPQAMFQTRYGLRYLHARGQYYLATQRGYAGLADFLACGDTIRALGLDGAVTVPWRASAAQAWLQLGNEDRARRLVREQLTRSEASGGSGRGRALRMLAAVSSPERRPQLLIEALELFEECGDQYEQAWTLADLGRTYSALGHSRRARTTLRRARHLANLCDIAPLCEELLAVGEPAGSPAGESAQLGALTVSERRVAHLAVLGYTNREIAEKLYVTPSTVEQHLTRVYRKLQIKRRHDLPADLGTVSAGSRRPSGQSAVLVRSVS